MGSTAEMQLPAVSSPPRLTVLRPSRQPQRRMGFVAAFELIGQRVAIYSISGALLHETAAMRDCRRDDTTARLVRAAIDGMIKRMVAAFPNDETPEPVCARDHGRAVYATLYQPGDEPMLLIHVVGLTDHHRAMTDHEIISRYRLTPAELRVARRLALGQANKVIAHELQVSEHTTRHQTESILRKLGVTSRGAVAQKLLG